MTQPKEYLSKVRDQYEDLPYPPRDPESEKTRIRVSGDLLPFINQVCFEGKQSFDSGFRALVAGGGTGDAAIFLGEQFRDKDAQIVYVDISEASMTIAKERAKVRGLTNIEWIHASVLDLPKMGLGEFDYINCSGMLHHLAEPDEGLKALEAVLKDDGAMQIMVYGQYGRQGIYYMQDLMRLLNKNTEDTQEKIDNTKAALKSSPNNSWYNLSKSLINYLDESNDEGIYDLYLHSQDRAYTLPQIYDWLERCDLEMQGPPGMPGGFRAYDPFRKITDPKIHALVKELPEKEQYCVGEMLSSNITLQVFFAVKKARPCLTLETDDVVPFLYLPGDKDHSQAFLQGLNSAFANEKSLTMKSVGDRIGSEITIMPHALNTTIIELILQDEFTVKQLVEKVVEKSEGVTEAAVFEQIKVLFTELYSVGSMYLRHKDTKPYRRIYEMMKSPE